MGSPLWPYSLNRPPRHGGRDDHDHDEHNDQLCLIWGISTFGPTLKHCTFETTRSRLCFE